MTLRRSHRPGIVLISVFVIITVLLLVAYQYLNLMTEEHAAVVAGARLAQSRHLADSGLHYAAFSIAYPMAAGLTDGVSENPLLWPASAYDNASIFRDRPVNGLNNVKGYFSIVSFRDPDDPDAGSVGYRFGLEDEGGKLNVNALRKLVQMNPSAQTVVNQLLTALPNGSPEIAAAILNWTSPGGTPEASEEQYYNSLGYYCKGGPFESLEEMLLVEGVTPTLLFGNDRNRNGRLDTEENQSTGVVDRGWQRYLTVYSRELNIDSTGQQRINLASASDLNALNAQLSTAFSNQELADFVTMALVVKPVANTSNSRSQAPDGIDVDDSGRVYISDITKLKASGSGGATGGSSVTSFFDFLDVKINVSKTKTVNNRQVTLTGSLPSPLQTSDKEKLRSLLPLLWDKCTFVADMEIPARININTMAPDLLRTSLETFGATETFIENLLAVRPGPYTDTSLMPVYRTPAWLITEANADPSIARLLEPYFTTYSQVYRFQVVGYTERRGPVTRLEAVVDANQGRPRILYWRDISELGRGFDFTRPDNIGR